MENLSNLRKSEALGPAHGLPWVGRANPGGRAAVGVLALEVLLPNIASWGWGGSVLRFCGFQVSGVWVRGVVPGFKRILEDSES